jgi:hypothetical protein
MRGIVSKLTYANVIATIALFLALGGGAVMAAEQLGKNAVKSKNIAANAVKTQDIAKNAVKAAKLAAKAVRNKNLSKNAVSGAKVRKGALTRSKLKAGTLAGLQVADVQATTVPGFSIEPTEGSQGTPIPLVGTPTFTAKANKSYVLMAELRGNPVDADGAQSEGYGGRGCYAWIRIYVNGEPTAGVEISANANAPAPYTVNGVGTSSTALALLTPGQPQTIAANAIGDDNCAAGTTGNLRIVVVELG